MFYTNEEVIGKRAALKQDYWTEKGVYLRGHVMKIKKLEGYLATLEDVNGELFVPLGCLDVLEETTPKRCHGTQTCPGFQENLPAAINGIRGRCTHGSAYGGCRRSDYQEDMEAWRRCLKSST